MKHAYLILSHNQFKLLQILVSAIDDERNDIYIHIDKKVKTLPIIQAKKSNIIFIQNRIDIYWGDVSVVKAEYILMEEAFYSGKNYRYFHLLSGVDIPLKNQNYIHHFFEINDGNEFIGYNNSQNLSKELDRKVHKIHIFPHDFRGNGVWYELKKFLRYIFIRVQESIRYKRYSRIQFKKGTQWFSITNNLVNHVLGKKNEVLKRYKFTFCPDEIFLQTIAWQGHFTKKIYCLSDEDLSCQREIGWINGVLKDFTIEDYDRLINSNKLFARKFTEKNMDIVYKIINNLKD